MNPNGVRNGLLTIAIRMVVAHQTIACASSNHQGQESADQLVNAPDIFSPNTAGEACAKDTDCGNGVCRTVLVSTFLSLEGVVDLPAPGGYCSFGCGVSADCGVGAICVGATANTVAAASAAGQCLRRCDSSLQCREGYRCLDGHGISVETDHVEAASDAYGACQVAPVVDTVMPGFVGNACASETECGGGVCLTEDFGLPGGYCSGRCVDNSDCPQDAACDTDEIGFVCLRVCQADVDCGRADYHCLGAADASKRSGRCFPDALPPPGGSGGPGEP